MAGTKKKKNKKESSSTTSNEQQQTSSAGQSALSRPRMILVGLFLVTVGTIGFYTIPGAIVPQASGSKLVNAFYCSVVTLTTVGFGDICPGKTDLVGGIFLTILPLLGLGFFCGPILTMASSWKSEVPGGVLALATVTLALGVSILTTVEKMSFVDAIHLSVITGTTIGYGNITPSSDLGRLFWAIYAILVCNVVGGFLEVGKGFLESFCFVSETPEITTTTTTTPSTTKSDTTTSDKKED